MFRDKISIDKMFILIMHIYLGLCHVTKPKMVKYLSENFQFLVVNFQYI